MKLEIELPQDKVDELSRLATEWKELSPYPLSNVERLQNLEKDISKHLTQIILSTNTLEILLPRLMINKVDFNRDLCSDGSPHACSSGKQFSEHYDETPYCVCRCGARHIQGNWHPGTGN